MIAAALAWIGWKWWPNEEKAVARQIRQLVEAASIKPDESSFSRLGYPDRISAYFTTNAVIQLDGLGGDIPAISSRTDLLAAAMAARSQLREAEFRLVDLNVTFPPEKGMANVYAIIVGKMNLQTNEFAQAFRMSLKKSGGKWLIEQMRTVDTLQ